MLLKTMITLSLPVLLLAAPPQPTDPVWHLPARCEEGDVNSLFQFNGMWHLMQQWDARPRTSVGHSVSADLLHFARLPNVLTSGDTGDQQCFDGSSSIVTRDGVLTPMLMIDGGCGEKGPGSLGCMESSGNGSTGGVTAYPTNLDDVNLTTWTRIGPTVFVGCDGSAGPSPIIKNPTTGKLQLIAIHGGGEALFEATSGTDSWKMVDPAFLPVRGGGGGLWCVLPPNVDEIDANGKDRWPTHIMQLEGGLGGGGATFALLQVDAPTSKVLNFSSITPVDLGPGVQFGQLSTAGGTGHSGAPGDNRVIHVSWLTTGMIGVECQAPDVNVGQLTSFRDLRFDPRLDALVENPIVEYLNLRREIIDQTTNTPITTSSMVMLNLGSGRTAVDIEFNLTVASSTSVLIGIACNAATDKCGTYLNLTTNMGAVQQSVVMQVIERDGEQVTQTATFPVFTGEDLPVRIMTDTRSVEIFAAYGRGVFSGGLSYDSCMHVACQITASVTGKGGANVTAKAWEMGSVF